MLSENNAQIKLFEGPLGQVEAAVNVWLSNLPNTARIAAVEYNYQGSEFDGQAVIQLSSHGVMVLVDMGYIPSEDKS